MIVSIKNLVFLRPFRTLYTFKLWFFDQKYTYLDILRKYRYLMRI